ncbi:uncharacterized protein LOC143367959 [Andrena cerasifolii]|uniref:uncharacterized protein LOC143367959 n=1 Tax=Andrena cerasifolii TaxID=2819439 RepID=UPI004037C90B
MVMFIERGISGGLSQCSGIYAQANNKYTPSYDASERSSYLMYFDVNNLYGWAMCQPLPYAKFQWVEDVENFDVSSIAVDSPTGYILEIDLEYPQRLYDAHADLPFCPTRAKPPVSREDELLATLYDKQRYVIHYRDLQQCTHHGLRNNFWWQLWDSRFAKSRILWQGSNPPIAKNENFSSLTIAK